MGRVKAQDQGFSSFLGSGLEGSRTHRALTVGTGQPCASLRHSPELPLQIHEVLLGQHHSWAGADDYGLAVLEVGCLEPPLRQLEKDQG